MIDRKATFTLSLVVLTGIGLTVAAAYGTESAQANIDVQDEPITVTAESPSGQVSALNVELDGTISWSGFETGVAEIGIHGGGDSEVYTPRGDIANASSGTFDLGQSEHGTFQPRIPADHFDKKLSVDEDGATKTRTVTVTFEGYVAGPDAVSNPEKTGHDVPFSVSRDIQVTVTNLPDDDDGGNGGNGDGDTDASVSTNFEWSASLEMANG